MCNGCGAVQPNGDDRNRPFILLTSMVLLRGQVIEVRDLVPPWDWDQGEFIQQHRKSALRRQLVEEIVRVLDPEVRVEAMDMGSIDDGEEP